MELSPEMRKLVSEQRLGFVATVSPEGRPALSPKGTTRPWGTSQLVFLHLSSHATVANLRRNPAVVVNVVDPIRRRGWRFTGRGRVVDGGGPELAAVLGDFEREGSASASRALAAVVVDVDAADELVSPAYADATEEEITRRWLAHHHRLAQAILDEEPRRNQEPGQDDEWRRDDERRLLMGFLQRQRETLAWKCSELSDGALRTDSVAASTLSLMGIVRHLTDVERSWVRRTLAGEDAPRIYYSDTSDWDRQFTAIHDVTWADTRRAWESEVRACDEVIARMELDDAGTREGRDYTLRWILVHLIEEYARHNGHADLIRESIDGQVGEWPPANPS
jgi:uncharacterized damage-inducible protein DinB